MENVNKQDQIRILRVIEYVGSRAEVEDCVQRSLHGVKQVNSAKGYYEIRAATVGTYPEVLSNLEVSNWGVHPKGEQ